MGNGDGAEWVWNHASMFGTFWNIPGKSLNSATDGVLPKPTAGFMRSLRICEKIPEFRESLQALIRYNSEDTGRMCYDEYLRLGCGIGSGAVESAHKQVVHARFRQAGMRWREAGARRPSDS